MPELLCWCGLGSASIPRCLRTYHHDDRVGGAPATGHPVWRSGPKVFGILPETLNDDRFGRALDEIAPQLDAIVGSVGAQAIAPSAWRWPGCTGT
jgi:hypothetical protein